MTLFNLPILYTRNPQNNIVPGFGRETHKQFFPVFNAKPIKRVGFHPYFIFVPYTRNFPKINCTRFRTRNPQTMSHPVLNAKPTTHIIVYQVLNAKPITHIIFYPVSNAKPATFLIRNLYRYQQHFNPLLLLLDL